MPELPQRVVAWVRRRRPAPSVAVQAVATLLGGVVERGAADQPGVHGGTDAFPLGRSV